MLMKAFGTEKRIYNSAAEMRLNTTLGIWIECAHHIEHTMVRDDKDCYLKCNEGLQRCKRVGDQKCFTNKIKIMNTVEKENPTECKVDGNMIFSHHTYNMIKKYKVHQPNTHEMSPVTLEVQPKNKENQLFSDGYAHTKEGKGACATIINMNCKQYTANRGL